MSDLTYYELFFEMEISLCERFPGLTPFRIRQEKAREVFLLIRRLHRYNELSSARKVGKNRVIRRPAGDNWF